MKLKGVILGVTTLLAVSPVNAQGIPTFDASNIAQAIKNVENQLTQITKMTEQLNEAKKIFDTAQKLTDSLNKITSIGDLASSLKDPKITNLFPQDINNIKGSLESLIKQNTENNTHYTRSGDDFYNKELQRQKEETAGNMSIGQSVYEAAGKRIKGIEELRDKVSSAKEPKEVMDLQARIQAEAALLQNEILRMQGLAMVQQAKSGVDEQRVKEEWGRRWSNYGQKFK